MCIQRHRVMKRYDASSAFALRKHLNGSLEAFLGHDHPLASDDTTEEAVHDYFQRCNNASYGLVFFFLLWPRCCIPFYMFISQRYDSILFVNSNHFLCNNHLNFALFSLMTRGSVLGSALSWLLRNVLHGSALLMTIPLTILLVLFLPCALIYGHRARQLYGTHGWCYDTKERAYFACLFVEFVLAVLL